LKTNSHASPGKTPGYHLAGSGCPGPQRTLKACGTREGSTAETVNVCPPATCSLFLPVGETKDSGGGDESVAHRHIIVTHINAFCHMYEKEMSYKSKRRVILHLRVAHNAAVLANIDVLAGGSTSMRRHTPTCILPMCNYNNEITYVNLDFAFFDHTRRLQFALDLLVCACVCVFACVCLCACVQWDCNSQEYCDG